MAKKAPPQDRTWDEEQEQQGAVSAGPVLTPRQQAGLDPINPEYDEEQAAHRDELPNQQTDHEAENVLDSVSREPSVGIAAEAFQEGERLRDGQKPTDMSGRPPMPMSGSEAYDRATRDALDTLQKAKSEDTESVGGWRNAQELGISRKVLDGLAAEGKLESATAPGGTYFPETGMRYRVK